MSSPRRPAANKMSPASTATAETVESYLDDLACLPRPPETFTISDVHKSFRGKFKMLTRSAIFTVCGEETRPGYTESKTRQVYRFTDWADERLDELLADRNTFCPCGHSGLVNCGDHFECSFDGCDETFTRDQLEVGE